MKNKAGWFCFLLALLVSSSSLLAQVAGQPRILKISGDGQLVQYLWSFTQPLVVRVVDGAGQPIRGRQVTWSDLGGISYASDKVTQTDANGFAFLQWIPSGNFGLGVPYLGYTITATTDVGSVSFSAVAYPFQTGSFNPQPLVQFIKPGQLAPPIQGRVGDRLLDAVRIAVVTTGGPGVSPGLPIPGVGLTVTSANQDPAQGPVASCEGRTALTNSDGIASCDLVITGVVGSTELLINAGDMVSSTAQLIVEPGVSSTITIVQGNNQSGVPGQTLPTPLVARVLGASGLPLPGAQAQWSVLTPGSLSLLNATTTSDAAGLVSANVQLGLTPGAYAVRVAAGGGQATFNLTVQGGVNPVLAVATVTLPNGAVGVVYQTSLAVSGGTPPYLWSVTQGSLPPGLTLSPNGIISGAPQTTGAFNLTVQVTDSTGATASRALSLAVGSGVIITTAARLPSAAPGVPYSQSLQAAGGSPPYSWSHNPGSFVARPLPPGLTLSPTGTLSGTPSQAGEWAFTIEARDTAGILASQTFNLTVATGGGGGAGSSPLTILTASLPAATTLSPYAVTFAASGGTAPYRWTVAAGNLPPGLNLTDGGVLSGIPTSSGLFGFTIRATDAGSVVASRTYSLEVSVSSSLSITTPATLTGGVVNISYLQPLAATGGLAPYSWTLVNGTLPPGILISTSGLLSGVPQTSGSYVFTLLVRDAAGTTMTRQFTLTITPGISIASPAVLPTAALGAPYNYTLAATGGSGQYTWTLFSGSLPQGLSLTPAGVILGTPNVAGAAAFIVRVADSLGLFRLATFGIEVSTETTLPRSGIVAQLAAGGGWNTALNLINPGSAGALVKVEFRGQDGAPISLPVTITQGASATTRTLNAVEATLPANGTLLIETINADALTTTGWADVRSSSPVSGFAIFRQQSPDGRVSEGTSPVDARAKQEVLVPYDNSAGFITGVAIVNPAAEDAAVTVIQRDDTGQEIARDTFTLPARGHTAFAATVQFPLLAGRRGTLELRTNRAEGIIALGLRFSPAATFTSIPVLIRP